MASVILEGLIQRQRGYKLARQTNNNFFICPASPTISNFMFISSKKKIRLT
jgi:hypothetical protein